MKIIGDSLASPGLTLDLADDEQLTFATPGGAEYDVAAKDWGGYLTPSLRGRLARFGLRPCFVRAPDGGRSLAVVEADKVDAFEADMAARGARLSWLDGDDLAARVAAAGR